MEPEQEATMIKNLDQASLEQLKALQAEVTDAIKVAETQRREFAIAAAEATVREPGFPLAELIASPKLPRSPRPPKYRNPKGSQQTWNGQGRRPKRFNDALACGNTERSMRIV